MLARCVHYKECVHECLHKKPHRPIGYVRHGNTIDKQTCVTLVEANCGYNSEFKDLDGQCEIIKENDEKTGVN